MRMRPVTMVLMVSLLANVVGIPWLCWRLSGYSMMYRRNVDYVAELAYTVGYHRGKGDDLGKALRDHPTRLTITKVEADAVDVVIWPARQQTLRLEFRDPEVCHAWLLEPSDGRDFVRKTGDE